MGKIWVSKHVVMSASLTAFIKEAFDIGGSKQFQLTDILEWGPTAPIEKECEILRATYGDFVMKRGDYSND